MFFIIIPPLLDLLVSSDGQDSSMPVLCQFIRTIRRTSLCSLCAAFNFGSGGGLLGGNASIIGVWVKHLLPACVILIVWPPFTRKHSGRKLSARVIGRDFWAVTLDCFDWLVFIRTCCFHRHSVVFWVYVLPMLEVVNGVVLADIFLLSDVSVAVSGCLLLWIGELWFLLQVSEWSIYAWYF